MQMNFCDGLPVNYSQAGDDNRQSSGPAANVGHYSIPSLTIHRAHTSQQQPQQQPQPLPSSTYSLPIRTSFPTYSHQQLHPSGSSVLPTPPDSTGCEGEDLDQYGSPASWSPLEPQQPGFGQPYLGSPEPMPAYNFHSHNLHYERSTMPQMISSIAPATFEDDMTHGEAIPASAAQGPSVPMVSREESPQSKQEGESSGQGKNGDESIKSDEPYAQLIHKAFLSRECQPMTLQDIYQWFRENTEKAKGDNKGWQNSIRHNLSMNHVSFPCMLP